MMSKPRFRHGWIIVNGNSQCPDCAEINRLKSELEEVNRKHVVFERVAECDRENMFELREQLFLARTEIEALTDCLNGSRKTTYTAEMYDKAVQQARQEAARECVEIVKSLKATSELMEIKYRIMLKFGLEKINHGN